MSLTLKRSVETARAQHNVPRPGELRALPAKPRRDDAIGARVKRPGEQLIGDLTELKVVTHPNGDEMDAYERLLGDAMAGDGALFTGQAGVEAAWAVVQPILGLVTPVHDYEPGTWGPPEAGRFLGCLPEFAEGEDQPSRSALVATTAVGCGDCQWEETTNDRK